DYFSQMLKNTSNELKNQDIQLRDILFHACLSNGLCVMGYSGRDTFIMEVLEKALNENTSFPQGIFWFIRNESKPLREVVNFIKRAKEKGIQTELIEIDTFDT